MPSYWIATSAKAAYFFSLNAWRTWPGVGVEPSERPNQSAGLIRSGPALLQRSSSAGGPLVTPTMLRRSSTASVSSITASSVLGLQSGSAQGGFFSSLPKACAQASAGSSSGSSGIGAQSAVG